MIPVFVLYIIVLVIAVLAILSRKQKPSPPRNLNKMDIDIPSQAIPHSQGIETQNHEDFVNNHYVHHDEPEQGYVVLNGIKRKLEDCKNL